MTEKNEQPTEATEVDAATETDAAAMKRRALMLKLAAGAFSAPLILAALSSKAAHASAG